jgi:hypothetical protein
VTGAGKEQIYRPGVREGLRGVATRQFLENDYWQDRVRDGSRKLKWPFGK